MLALRERLSSGPDPRIIFTDGTEMPLRKLMRRPQNAFGAPSVMRVLPRGLDLTTVAIWAIEVLLAGDSPVLWPRWANRPTTLSALSGRLASEVTPPPEERQPTDHSRQLLGVATSGTTGIPKTVFISAERAFSLADVVGSQHACPPGGNTLVLREPSSSSALVGDLLPLTLQGRRMIFASPLRPERVLTQRSWSETTCVHAGPLPLARLLLKTRGGSALSKAFVSGERVPPWLPVLAGERSVALDVGYGLSEAGPRVSMGTLSRHAAGPPHAGEVLPGVRVELDEAGRVHVRSAFHARACLDHAAGQLRSIPEQIVTEDVATWDSARRLVVLGRGGTRLGWERVIDLERRCAEADVLVDGSRMVSSGRIAVISATRSVPDVERMVASEDWLDESSRLHWMTPPGDTQ